MAPSRLACASKRNLAHDGSVLPRTNAALGVTLALVALASVANSAPSRPASATLPASPKRPVHDRYFDQTVTDDYRWLENWDDPAVRRWSAAENAVTRGYLDRLPDHGAILKRLDTLTRDIAPAYSDLQFRSGIYFALKDEPPKQQPMIVRLPSIDRVTGEKVIVDPNTIDPSGGTSIDFFVPSRDGSKVAVSLSRGGSESGTVYVYDTRTGTRLSDFVPRVNGGTAGGSVAWDEDGSGFYHTRYPTPGERPREDLPFWQQLYFHRLGTPASADRYVLGKELPKIAEIVVTASEDGKRVLADVRNGDGGEHAFYVKHPGQEFQQISRFGDRVVAAAFGPRALYLLSRQRAPNGQILQLEFGRARLAEARVVVPASVTPIQGIVPAKSRLYALDILGGPAQVRVFDLAGSRSGAVPLPSLSSVSNLVHLDGDRVGLEIESYTRPPYWARFDAGTGRLVPTALAMRSPADFSDVQVLRELAVSKDGTRVPINVLMKRGTKRDGKAPLLLTGYGGYGISMSPSFSPTRRLWLDQGGIVAIANLRGGGEFGDAWHLAGNLTHKQNVFDDFAAAAQHLIDHRYTSSAHLAMQGGSNGGLLMGAMITQHPDLARVVISNVGIYDMLRVELTPNGLFNTTEFGSVKNPEQFRALYAYSPYHHVVNGTKYPAILFTTGANDPRVDPMHSRKMTARLQAANASGLPILLRTSGKVGHGVGSPRSERNAQSADVYSFMLKQLGMKFREPVQMPAP